MDLQEGITPADFEVAMQHRISQTPPERRSDAQTAAERLAICNSCELKGTRVGFPACTECGCFLRLKAIFKYSKCPLKKWETPAQ